MGHLRTTPNGARIAARRVACYPQECQMGEASRSGRPDAMMGMTSSLLSCPMSPDHAFVRSICETPDDDTPRLVYADWLEEQGDPRGEFIRVECRLGRLLAAAPARHALEQRARQLLCI